MPQIPTSQGPRVRTDPLPAPLANPGMASAAAFGAGVGAGARDAISSISQANARADAIREQEMEKKRQDDAFAAANAAHHEITALTAKARMQQGKAAEGLTQRTRTDYDKITGQIGAKITDPETRAIFDRQMADKWRDVDSVVTNHAESEVYNYRVQEYDAANANERMSALQVDTPERIAESLAKQEAGRFLAAESLGEDPDTTALKVAKDRTDTISAAIDQRMTAKDYAGAKAYLDQFGDQLPKSVRSHIQANLKTAGESLEAQKYADTIMREPSKTKAIAYQQIKMIEDPTTRARVEGLVEKEFANREAVKRETQTGAFETLAKEVEANGGDLNAASGAHASMWNALDLRERDTLRGLSSDIAKGKQPAPLGDRFIELQTLSSSPALRQQFLETNLAVERGRMTASELKELLDLQGKLRADPDKGGGEKQASLASMERVVDQTLAGLGLDSSILPTSKNRDDALAFRRQLQQRVWANEKATGKKLDETGMLQIADGLVREVAINRSRSGVSPMRLFSGPTYEEKVPAYRALMEVPEVDQQAIRDAFKESGVDATEADIIRAFNARKAREAQAAPSPDTPGFDGLR